MIMKLKGFIFTAVAAVVALAACQNKEDLGTPNISLSTAELTFTAEGGEQALTLEATRDWSVKDIPTWLGVSPEEGSASSQPQTVVVTVLKNDGYNRSADLKFTLGTKSKYLTVTQAGPKGDPSALVIYANDFDASVAEKKYGAKEDSWPYCDQFDGWKNETGSGAGTVSYAYKSASPRASSSNNNIWLPKTGAYFSIRDITLGGATKLKLSFGTICGSTGDHKKTFEKNILKVYVSADKAKWVDLDYNLTVNTGFDFAETTFSVPAGTEKLTITFEKIADEVDGYRIDNVNLVSCEGETAIAVDFANGVDKTYNDGVAGSGGNTGGGSTTTPDNAILYEPFASGIGSFSIEDKVELPSGVSYVWKQDATYGMVASGYVSGTNHAVESWLVSSEIDLTSQTDAYLSFEHACNFFLNVDVLSQQAVVMVTKDGTNWDALTPEYPTSMSWSYVYSGELSLKAYVGNKVRIAFKYVSTAEKAGTWEIKNVLVSTKKEDTSLPSGLEGDGTETNPFTVEDVITLHAQSFPMKSCWVKGIISGVYNSGSKFDTEVGSVNTNIAIGTAEANIPVQLPQGDLRTALNLVDNPTNVGKEVLLRGSVETYFKVAGLKNTSAYKFVE